jgi:hypothetical protein
MAGHLISGEKRNTMFEGRTLTQLAQEIERQAHDKRDFKAPTTMMQMSVITPQDRLDDTPRQVKFQVGDIFDGSLNSLAHDHLGRWCGIPGPYYDRMLEEKPELLSFNVNAWLQSKERKETRLVRTLDGRARAFLSHRYRTIDHDVVANAALPVLIDESKKLGGVKIMSSEVTERRLYIKVVSERLTYEVKKGDAVQAGISLSNSEVGQGSVKVEPFLYRLVCLNGAVIEDSAVRKFHIGRSSAELGAAEEVFRDETREADDKVFVMKLQDVLRAAFDDESFDQLKGLTIDASTRKIKKPVDDFVEEVVSVYKLNKGHKDSFLRNLIEGADLTQWGVANAVTAIANTANDYETATELERVGGAILAMDAGQWKEIAA